MNTPSESGQSNPRLDAALAEYMRLVDGGSKVDRDAFIAAHAEVADELRSHFDTTDALLQMAGPPVAAVGTDDVNPDDVKPAVREESVSSPHRDTFKPGESIDSTPESSSRVLGSIPKTFGRYRIERTLGQGAMGAVFLAFDTQLERHVALKIPKFSESDGADLVERFYREARSAATLRHPNICAVYDIGEIDGVRYITMAYIEGRLLSDYVNPDRLPSQTSLAGIVRKVALALESAHAAGVVHRDLKPDNIMIDQKQEPVVMDFGLARQFNQQGNARLTQTGMIIGTPAYMPPEQIEGRPEAVGPPCDIYSLGVILYELLAGQLPFQGSIAAVIGQVVTQKPVPPSELRKGLDPRLETICLKMMAKQPDDRYRSMGEVAQALTDYIKTVKREKKSGVAAVIEPVEALPVAEIIEDAEIVEPIRQSHKRSRIKQSTADARLEARKDEIKALIKRNQCAAAVRLLEKMSRLTGPRAARYVEWAEQQLPKIKSLPEKFRSESGAAERLAGQLIEKHDYAQAAQLLQQIPADYRTAEINTLLDRAIELQDEVDLLIADIEDAVSKREMLGLLPNVRRLLELKPGNHRAQELQRELTGRRQQAAKIVTLKLGPMGIFRVPRWAIWTAASAITAVVVFNVATFFLKTEHGMVKIELNDPNAEIYIDGNEVAIRNIDKPITLKLGPHSLVVKRDGVEVETRDFKVVKGGTEVVRIQLIMNPPPPPPPPPPKGKWKDLTAFKFASEKHAANWFGINTLPKTFVKQSPDVERRVRKLSAKSKWIITHPRGKTAEIVYRFKQPMRGFRATIAIMNPDMGSGRLRVYADGKLIALSKSVTFNSKAEKVEVSTPPSTTLRLEVDNLGKSNGDWFLMADPEVLFGSGSIPTEGKTPTIAAAPFDEKQARRHQQAWAKYLDVPVDVTNSIGMKLRLVPPGEFQLGTTEEQLAAIAHLRPKWYSMRYREASGVKVRITRPYYIGQFEVTQQEYEKIVGSNPSHFSKQGKGKQLVSNDDTSRHPVETVSWNDAVRFCNLLSKREGLPTYYAIKGNSTSFLGGNGYRLPTEAEWEYACRAGSTGLQYFGDNVSQLPLHAWINKNSKRHTHPVGKKLPNGFGLHDLYGNVWEKCQGWSPAGSVREGQADPQDPISPKRHAVRGGYYASNEFLARSAAKSWNDSKDPGARGSGGFRVVRNVASPNDPTPITDPGVNPSGNFALEFDGKSSYVEIPTLKYDGSHPLTVEALVSPSADTLKAPRLPTIVGDWDWDEGFGFVATEKGFARIGLLDSGAKSFRIVDSNRPLSANTPVHLAFVFDGKNLRLFVNGKRQTSEKVVMEYKPSQFHFRIGHDWIAEDGRLGYRGVIDEVRISKAAIYTTDFMPQQRLKLTTNTLALYHFDEGQGNKLTDASGNKHHGKIVAAKWVPGIEAKNLGSPTPTEILTSDEWEWSEPVPAAPAIKSNARMATTADGLTVFFGRRGDIWTSKRSSTKSAFGTSILLGPTVNSKAHDGSPALTADGLNLFFDSQRPGGFGTWNIWMASRESVGTPFGASKVLGANVNGGGAAAPAVTSDRLILVFHSSRSKVNGRVSIWQSRRASTNEPFGPAVLLGRNINKGDADTGPTISADGRELFFTSDRAGGQGNRDLWTATRPTVRAPFGPAVNLGRKINSPQGDYRPTLSPDGRTLYFHSKRPGSKNGLWVVRRVRKPVQPSAVIRTDDHTARRDWVDLFNGKDLTDWTVMRATNVREYTPANNTSGWEVRNGEIICTDPKGTVLQSKREYGDYVFQMEYKLPDNKNTAIYARAPAKGFPWKSAINVQIIDNDYEGRTLKPDRRNGAILGIVPPLKDVPAPVDQWNQIEVRCEGNNVQISVNGTRVVNYDMGKNKSLRTVPPSGYICLSNVRGLAVGTAYRDIRIRELSGSSLTASNSSVLTYDASSGKLPSDVGWTFDDRETGSSTVKNTNGLLIHDARMKARSFWTATIPADQLPDGAGVFMETTVRVVREKHHPKNKRGIILLEIREVTPPDYNSLVLYGHQDRVFLFGGNDEKIGDVPMDTSDGFHTYRVELKGNTYWLYIDGTLAMEGRSAAIRVPGKWRPSSPKTHLGAKFGDGSAFSSSLAERKRVVFGPLVTVGGIKSVGRPASDDDNWETLFDGSSTEHWRKYNGGEINGGWVIENGALTLKTSGTGDIITKKQYGDFELELEWKIAPGGNSGIVYRVTESAKFAPFSGPEYQLLDDEAFRKKKRAAKKPFNPNVTAGAIYGLVAPKGKTLKPVGQYNTARIIVRGNHVEHWLNGKQVVSIEMHGNQWNKLVKGSKFARKKQIGSAKKGHIVLQDHRSPVWFRNIRIRELGPASTSSAPVPATDPQRRAAERILELGGRISPGRGWIRDTSKLPEKPFTIKFVWLRKNSRVTDDDLKLLAGLTSITSIDLMITNISDEGLKHLGGLTELQTLYLSSTHISGAGLKHLKGLSKLSTLAIINTGCKDDDLQHLVGLEKLQFLSLPAVGNVGVDHLSKMKQLERLYFRGSIVPAKGIDRLRELPQLHTLSLFGKGVTDEHVRHLAGLKQLQTLTLFKTGATDAALPLLKKLPNLTVLNLDATSVGDSGLKHFKGMPALRNLVLRRTKVTDAGLAEIAKLTKLEVLSLYQTKIGDAGLEHLKGLTALKSLELRKSKVTAAGVDKLRDALPDCRIFSADDPRGKKRGKKSVKARTKKKRRGRGGGGGGGRGGRKRANRRK